MIGRPQAFSQEKADRVCEAVRRGMSYKQAAAYAGISYSTLNRWRIEGQDEEGAPEFWEFWKSFEQAAGEAAFRNLGYIDEAASRGDWKAAAWMLERRYPEEWGKGRRHRNDPLEPMLS
jgi:hypothetical protein